MIDKIQAGYGIKVTTNDLGNNFYSSGTNLNDQWQNHQQYTVKVELELHVIEVLNWANAKMAEEIKLQQLASRYPILEDAIRDLEVIKALIKGKQSQ
jgi:hypothetical protein